MVLWIKELEGGEIERIGKLAQNLSKASELEVDVPKGFVIPPEVFKEFLEINRIKEDVFRRLERVNEFESCKNASKIIQKKISNNKIPEKILEDVLKSYSEINVSRKVRKAGKKAVDLVGNQRTYETVQIQISLTQENEKNIFTAENGVSSKRSLRKAIKTMWKKYFSPEAVYIRNKKSLNSSLPALIVHKSVQSDVSGTVFTRSPADKKLLEIESSYGMIKGIKKGEVFNDRFIVERSSGKIVEKKVVEKEQKFAKNPATGKITKQPVNSGRRNTRSLDTGLLTEVVNKCLKIEKKFSKPVKVDFGVERNRIKVTGIQKIDRFIEQESGRKDGAVTGVSVNSLEAEGNAETVYTSSENCDGKIAILENASKNFLELVTTAEGIVADKGGRSSHLSIICGEIEVPSLFGSVNATEEFEDGEEIVLEGLRGRVLRSNETERRNTDKDVFSGNLVASKVLDKEEIMAEPSFRDSGYLKLGGDYRELVEPGRKTEGYVFVQRLEDIFNTDSESVLIDSESLEGLEEQGLEEVFKVCDKFEEKILLLGEQIEDSIIAESVGSGVDVFIAGEDADREIVRRKVAKAEKKFILQSLRELRK